MLVRITNLKFEKISVIYHIQIASKYKTNKNALLGEYILSGSGWQHAARFGLMQQFISRQSSVSATIRPNFAER